MNLFLMRTERRADGIFGELRGEEGKLIAHTLEHAYRAGNGFEPKIPGGVFTCRRGNHRLHGMTSDFSTFEITGVAGHSNLLFHWGNYNRDSEGCVLLGEKVASCSTGEMITNSRACFGRFLDLQDGLDDFILTVMG